MENRNEAVDYRYKKIQKKTRLCRVFSKIDMTGELILR